MDHSRYNRWSPGSSIMAEGGGEEGDENPFSYKNFVHTKDKNILTPQNDDEFVRSSQSNDILDGTNALFPDNDFTSPVCQPAEQGICL